MLKLRTIFLNETNVVDLSKRRKNPLKTVLISKKDGMVINAKDFVLVKFDNEAQEDAIVEFDFEQAKNLGAKFFEVSEGNEIEPALNENAAQIEEEANYPKGFSIKEFKSLPSFKERVQYARERLSHIGTGSARVVFDADDKTVLKVAKNKKGLAQNNLEIELAGYYDTKGVVAQILDSGDNGFWLEAEKAEKMTEKKFAAINGFSFAWFSQGIISQARGTNRKPLNAGNFASADPKIQNEIEAIKNSDLFNDIVQFIESYEMSAGDITRLSSWGIVTRNGKKQCVLVDYGFNKEIQDSYYSPKKH